MYCVSKPMKRCPDVLQKQKEQKERQKDDLVQGSKLFDRVPRTSPLSITASSSLQPNIPVHTLSFFVRA